jgi:urease accessory protein
MKLPLLQLGDSALPIGGYSHSWGLEAAIHRGLVRDGPSLERWVRQWLCHTVGPCEGIIVAATCRAAMRADWGEVRRANQVLSATITPTTLRHASQDMGEQLLGLAETWPWASEAAAELRLATAEVSGEQGWHHAPVFGALAGAAGASTAEAVLVYLHQAALGAIGAGVRAVPVGHTHGQQALAHLHTDLGELAESFADRGLEDAGSFCPAYEVLCHAQSRLYTRIFRS